MRTTSTFVVTLSCCLVYPAVESKPLLAQSILYKYTGPTFTDPSGDGNFTTSDSITGTMTLLDPPIGDGTFCFGDCNITAMSMTASSSNTPVTFTLADADTSSWFFTFDVDGNITDWSLRFEADVAGDIQIETLGTEFKDFLVDEIQPGARTLAVLDENFPGAQTSEGNSGFWTIVPEPSAFALTVLGFVSVVFFRRKPRLCPH